MKLSTIRRWIILCIVVICLTGCGSSITSTVKYIKLTEQEQRIASLTTDHVGILNISFADDIQSMVLYLDVWKNGECISSELLSYSEKQDNAVYIAIDGIKSEDLKSLGTVWNVGWKETPNGGMTKDSFTVNFDEHEQTGGGYVITFLGEENGSAMLKADDHYVLAMEGYAFADGISYASCETLSEKPEYLKAYDYAVVLRMDTFADAESAKASFDVQND